MSQNLSFKTSSVQININDYTSPGLAGGLVIICFNRGVTIYMKGLIGFMAKRTIQIDVVSMYGPGKPIPDVKQASPAENVTADAHLVRQLISIPLLAVYEAGTKNVINGHNFYQYFPEEQPGGGGGGGGGHIAIVTTIPNAEVTLTSLDYTYTGTAGNTGKLELTGVAAGTYTVSATYDGATSDTASLVITDHDVTEDSFASLTISASANTTITVTDGTVTKTLEYTGTPIVQYVSLGTWDLSCTIDDTVITRSVLVDSYTNQNIVLAPPSAAIQRYVDFTTNTTTLTGDPDTHPVYMGINRCNVSDDGTINAYYGDAGYTEDGSNGQVMVKIPKFYYKVTPDSDGGLDGVHIRKCTWEISDSADDGFTLHPAFYDASGNEIDYFLYGAFDAVGQNSSGTYGTSYNTASDKLSSVAGSSMLPTNSLTRATARTMATNRGAGWYSVGVKQTMAVQMLMAVEYGFNSQIGIGQGVVSASAATYAGQTTGNVTSGTQDNKTTPVNWRGIENFWGNINDWIDGLNLNNRVPYFCNSYAFVDDTATGYTQISFSLPSSNNYITALGYDSNNPWVMLPSESSSTSNPTGPIGDRVSSNSGWRVALLGGSSYDSDVGAFFWSCHYQSSIAYAVIGARAMFIPSAV